MAQEWPKMAQKWPKMAHKLAPTRKIAEIYLPYLPLFPSLPWPEERRGRWWRRQGRWAGGRRRRGRSFPGNAERSQTRTLFPRLDSAGIQYFNYHSLTLWVGIFTRILTFIFFSMLLCNTNDTWRRNFDLANIEIFHRILFFWTNPSAAACLLKIFYSSLQNKTSSDLCWFIY